MKRSLVVLTFLMSVAAAASAQITSERPVSTPVYASRTAFSAAAIASNGDQFLAAWIDEGYPYAVHVSRIDRDGSVLDPLGIVIAPQSNHPGPVGVAWDGEAYVVAWPGPNGNMAARIGSDGRIVEPPSRLALSGNLHGQNAIAANGNVTVIAAGLSYFVLDHELRSVISGSLSNASVFKTGADEFTLMAPTRIQRLDAAGHSVSIAVRDGLDGDAISCHGQNCIRVSSNAGTTHLTVALYDPISLKSGTPLDLAMTQRPFALVAIDSGYLLATNDGSIQRFDISGHPSGEPTSPCCPPGSAVASASNGREVVVLRQSYAALTYSMVTSSSDGAPQTLALTANAQRSPAIARSGSNYLVAWTEDDGVYAGLLSIDGTILDGRGRQLWRGAPASPFDNPAPLASVVFDGASYLVAVSTNPFDPPYPSFGKRHNSTITIVRIDPATGANLDSWTICGSDMHLARSGTSTVAVWVDCDGRLEAAFLAATGAVSIPITLSAFHPPGSSWFPANPNLAWNGTEWLLTWEEQAFLCTYCPGEVQQLTGAISAMRLSAALTPIDTKPIAIQTGDYYYAPTLVSSSRLASDGNDFLVVWSDRFTALVSSQRISAAGTLLDGRPVATGRTDSLVWDGAAYSMALTVRPYESDLALLRLTAADHALDSLVISTTSDEEHRAALVPLGGGKVLAAYSRVAHEPLYAGLERVFIAAPHPARVRSSRTETP
ncbi:MAG: hypothetical protein QOC81_1024 [Thermoanaerobaculia bacterium]|jgi:hypothetical protein|nr:hypothetical protein [Thermoanaerobaculia bacterium]